MPIGDNIANKKFVSELFRVANKIKVGLPVPALSGGLRRILNPANWAETFWGAAFRVLVFLGIEELLRDLISGGIGAGVLVMAKTHPEKTMEAIGWIADEITAFEGFGTELAGITINQMTGAGLDVERIKLSLGLEPIGESRRIIGEEFTKILPGMFDVGEAQASALSRTDYSAYVNNLNRYFGTNLSFQLRSMVISTISSTFGWAPLRHLETLHQSVNWAYGFGWLSWTVLSAIMDVTTTQGLKKKYNALIKPNDYTGAQAIDAFLRGWDTEEVMNLVLDNQGERLDIRDTLVNLNRRWVTVSEGIDLHLRGWTDAAQYQTDMTHQAVPVGQRSLLLDLNESMIPDGDITQLFQRGLVDEQDVLLHFRHKGYRDERAKLEQATVVNARVWELMDKITESYGRLYRDGVIGEGEFRQWLSSANWTNDEMDLRIAFEELERRQRTFLSTGDLKNAVDLGLMAIGDAWTELTFRGYTPEDATIVTALAFKDHTPACEKERVKNSALIAFLQGLGAQAGVNPALLRPQILRYLQCLNEAVPLILPVVTLKATPDHVVHSGVVTLEWNTEFATSASLQPGIGPVPLSGKTEIVVTSSRSYTLVAVNPLGQSRAFAFVNVSEA
jgi:hypothetical protein